MVKLKEVSIAIFYIMHLSNDLTQCLSYVSSDKESGMKTGVNIGKPPYTSRCIRCTESSS